MDYKKKFSKKALNDFKLIDLAINNNDQNAYSEIMKSYKNSIYFTILKMIKNRDDAEDLTIEAFSKAFKNLHKFKKEFTFSTWLFRIATNNTIDFIRKKKLSTTSIHTSLKDEAGQNIELDIKDSNLNPDEITVKNEKPDAIAADIPNAMLLGCNSIAIGPNNDVVAELVKKFAVKPVIIAINDQLNDESSENLISSY